MALRLGEVIAAFDDGAAEVVYDSSGPFQTVQDTRWVTVASFTMPRAGSVIATMWFTPGSSATASYRRKLTVYAGSSSVSAELTYASETHILSCYGDLPAGAAMIRVSCANSYATGSTTPTRIRVITWGDNA